VQYASVQDKYLPHVNEALKNHVNHNTASDILQVDGYPSVYAVNPNATEVIPIQHVNDTKVMTRVMNEMGMNEMGMNEMGMNEMGMNEMGMNEMGTNQTKTKPNPPYTLYGPENEVSQIKKTQEPDFIVRNSKNAVLDEIPSESDNTLNAVRPSMYTTDIESPPKSMEGGGRKGYYQQVEEFFGKSVKKGLFFLKSKKSRKSKKGRKSRKQ
jgi:hypothetical protein